MNRYLKIFFIISLFFLSSTMFIHSKINVDSLLQAAKTAKGDHKLEIYKQLAIDAYVNYYLDPSLNLDSIAEIQQLEIEAKQQSSSLYLGYAYLYKTQLFALHSRRDSIPYYMTYAIAAFDKHEKWLALRLAYDLQINNYILESKYELALYYIERLLEKGVALNDLSYQSSAYMNMGMTYTTSRRDEKALDAFEKGIELRNKYTSKEKDADTLIIYYVAMTSSAIRNKQYDRAEQYCKTIEGMLQQILITNPTYTGYLHFFSRLVYAQLYTHRGDYQRGKKILDEIQSDTELINTLPNAILIDYYTVILELDYRIRNYEPALARIDTLLKLVPVNSTYYQSELLTYKSKILRAQGKNDQAYDLLSRISHMNDSVANLRMSEQMIELETIYEVDKMKAKMEVDKARLNFSHTVLIALACVSLLLILIVAVIIRNNRVKEDKNKVIFNQYLSIKEYLKEINAERRKMQEVVESDAPETVGVKSLCDKAEYYLKSTSEFKNPNISRNDLALDLGTNRQYLTEAIREQTGKTFLDYINDFRLEYAYDKLIKDFEQSIESIFLDAGFSSKSTFYRLFKNQYGMTPNELREVVRNTEKELLRRAVG